MTWEIGNDEALARVRRIAVTGGWLYQVEIEQWSEPGRVGTPSTNTFGWHPPVFVPAPAAPR